MRHVDGRRQISTVFYLLKRCRERPRTLLYTPVLPHRASDAFRNRRQRPRAKRPAGCRCSRSARQNPRQRGLLPVAAAAAFPLVHRRTQAGRGETFTQGIGPRPRAVREGNGLRWRCRSGGSGRCQAAARQIARVLRAAIRSRRHLAAEGQLRARLRTEFRRSHRHGWSSCPPRTARESSGSESQPRGDWPSALSRSSQR